LSDEQYPVSEKQKKFPASLAYEQRKRIVKVVCSIAVSSMPLLRAINRTLTPGLPIDGTNNIFNLVLVTLASFAIIIAILESRKFMMNASGATKWLAYSLNFIVWSLFACLAFMGLSYCLNSITHGICFVAVLLVLVALFGGAGSIYVIYRAWLFGCISANQTKKDEDNTPLIQP
jgi:hypothetical protein